MAVLASGERGQILVWLFPICEAINDTECEIAISAHLWYDCGIVNGVSGLVIAISLVGPAMLQLLSTLFLCIDLN